MSPASSVSIAGSIDCSQSRISLKDLPMRGLPLNLGLAGAASSIASQWPVAS